MHKLKVLVLGCSGMLGYQVLYTLSALNDFHVVGACRDPKKIPGFVKLNLVEFDAFQFRFDQVSGFDVIINCIGAIKQKEIIDSEMVYLNSYFPHLLASHCDKAGIKFIHISSDCVFNGLAGSYTENCQPNASDLYGKSKAIGEMLTGRALILRTSIIGFEMFTKYSLLSWFFSQKGGVVNGFTNAFFSGVTALEFSTLLADLLQKTTDLSGLYNVSGPRISKYDLLVLVNQIFGLGVNVRENPDLKIDRSLADRKFREKTGLQKKVWYDMLVSLKTTNVERG